MADTRNVSFKTLYGGQFPLSTQLTILMLKGKIGIKQEVSVYVFFLDLFQCWKMNAHST